MLGDSARMIEPMLYDGRVTRLKFKLPEAKPGMPKYTASSTFHFFTFGVYQYIGGLNGKNSFLLPEF